MSSRIIDPIVSIYIHEEDEDQIVEYLKTKIPEQSIKEPRHRVIMERLGF